MFVAGRTFDYAGVPEIEIPDVAALGRTRMDSMREFLADFPAGRQEERYRTAALPSLPFPDAKFDLALCSHYLFLYGTRGLSFHVASIIELTRVATEVRIFPLVELNGRKSPLLPAVMEAASASELVTEIGPVRYEFQRGANEMLRIRRSIPQR